MLKPGKPLTVSAVLLVAAVAFTAVAFLAPTRFAISQESDVEEKQPERVLVEIYRIAPGKHEAFLRDIASYDKANELAGLPPRQLYVHSDGAGWDFMLIQPASTPLGKAEALSAAWEQLDLPSGADFFLQFRENITEHSDTFARGPTSASAYLETLED